MLDAAAQDELDDRLPGAAVRRSPRDRLPPLADVRQRQVAQARGVREPLQVRVDLLRVTIDDADGLEDAVAALGAELADGERRSRRVDLLEAIREIGVGGVSGNGVDEERETPGHALSLRAKRGCRGPTASRHARVFALSG